LEIFQRAAQEERVLVSADTDFGALLAQWGTSKPSIILWRKSVGRRPEDQIRILLANFSILSEALEAGCVAVIEETRIRIRKLPIFEGQ